MKALLFSHPACSLHDAGEMHPERPARLDAAIAGVRGSGLDVVERIAPRATAEQLHAAHDPDYVTEIERFCRAGGGSLDPDTAAVPESWEAALRAAGSGISAVEALAGGEGEIAVCVVRPPGHHALEGKAMGFCLFNNVAVAAEVAAARGETVAIVDWDVHHGNGTQDTYWRRPDVLYLSTHEFPFYPGTGWVDESGVGRGAGTTVNVPLPALTAGDAARFAFERLLVPAVEQYAPDWLFISAGYDAHEADPLADLRFGSEDYAALAGMLREVGAGRTVVFLEGGYDLAAIESSVAATLRGFAGEPAGEGTTGSPTSAFEMIGLAMDAARAHWQV
jgi:acetoin utilization deacetylase AcuC-like enzyme